MSFSPLLPTGGLTGWAFLNRTADAQKEVMSETQSVKRLTDAFRARISDINSAEALIEDRELLTVTLAAFGLEEDINSKFYIQTILEQDTFDQESLSNRVADKRYLEMAQTFAFGDLGGPKTKFTDFADKIIERYETKEFETRVGVVDEDMRLAKSDQVSDLLDEESIEKLTNTFLLRSQLDASNSVGSEQIALTILQSAPRFF